MTAENLDIYFSGQRLYGDDFTGSALEKWYADEKEGYADLGARDKGSYRYAYHELNRQQGFHYFGDRTFGHALGLGSAYGNEFLPLAGRIERLTVLDPSDAFASTETVHGIPCVYRKPDMSGTLDFPDNHFDLIVCLGVLHHIANVSHVMNECYRCLAPGGIMLVREPITSMGDWRKPRQGLTKRERGIPYPLFAAMIDKAGFVVIHWSFCNFQALARILVKAGVLPYNHPVLTWLDVLSSRLLRFNLRYHATSIWHKFRPSAIQYVLTKAGSL